VIGDQQKDVAGNIAALEQQLNEVRDALATRPTTNDAAVSAAFAQAYSQQLLGLTQAYTRLQMNTQNTTSPLIRYGDASPAQPVLTLKKALPIGFGAGVALGAGAAFALELRARRRKRSEVAEVAEVETAAPSAVPSSAPPAAPSAAPPTRRSAAPTVKAEPTVPPDLRRLQQLYRESRTQEQARPASSSRWPAS